MEKILARVEKYIIYATVFLIPLSVFSLVSNAFVVPKLIVLVYGVALALIVRCLRTIISGKLDLKISNFDLPVLLIMLSYTLSAILRTPNKMEAFLLPGTATAFIGAAFLYILINQLSKEDKKNLSILLIVSGAIYSFLTIISFTGVLKDINQIPALLRVTSFSPDGGYLPSAIFLISLIPISIGNFLTEKQSGKKSLLGLGLLIIAVGLLVSIYNMLPGKAFTPRFPSTAISWSIAVDSLKNSPILGVGPGNYLTAFNRFRPIEYNATDLWALRFTTANNFLFTHIAETGFLGLAAFSILLYYLYKNAKKDLKEQKLVNWGFPAMSDLLSLVIMTLAFLTFPATVLLAILFFIYLSFYVTSKSTSLDLTAKASQESSAAVNQVTTRFPALLLTIPVIVSIIYLSIYSSKIVRAEYKFAKASNYLIQNKAQETYDTMREAISLNPYVDRYHSTFSRINLLLANSIANNIQQQGKTATDQERATITTLIQQAIAEAKSAVALNSLRSGNWEVLAQTYRAIIPLAQGADAFAAQSYRQAIALDPLNPNLRIAFGGLYYAAKDYDTATSIFELAVATKPDHANARYNLAFALNEKGNLDRAITEMTTVLSLIKDKEGEDFKIAQKALSDMQAKKAATTETGKELNPPTSAEEPKIKPPIQLPEGSEPPQAPISPAPEEATTPSPTATP